MTFPTYVHSVIPSADPSRWPVAPQGECECDFAATANALNLLLGERRYTKDEFIRAAGVLFQPRLGGTISPLSHVGMLSRIVVRSSLSFGGRRAAAITRYITSIPPRWRIQLAHGSARMMIVGFISSAFTWCLSQVTQEDVSGSERSPSLGD